MDTSPAARWRAHSGAAVLCAGLLALGVAATTATAFVLEGPSLRPWAPAEDVMRAARWDANTRALTETGERGLGGGLEYAIDDSVCAALPFLDTPAPPCSAIKAAIADAMTRWTVDHPTLRFVEVTDTVAVRMQGRAAPHDGQGAEIDFIAMGPDRFMAFANRRIAAMTNAFFDTRRKPTLTTGAVADLSVGAMTATDVRLSTRACYFLDIAFEKIGCAHFPSLIKHEIGHVLGIEHPDQFPDRNLARAAAAPPSDACAEGLMAGAYQPSAEIPTHAAARSVLYGADVWRHGLAPDDIAGRDALYPPCARDAAPTPRPTITTAAAVDAQTAAAGKIASRKD